MLKHLRKLHDILHSKAPASASRSPHWEAVRKQFLAKYPKCEVCGRDTKLQVHHVQPFHLNPELELSETNLITLCEGNSNISCHITFGHLLNFKSINVNVREDAKIWKEKIAKRP